MTRRSLVVDANILVSGVLGTRVSSLIASAQSVTLLTPDAACEEAREHLGDLIPRRGLDPEIAWTAFEEMLLAVLPVEADKYDGWRNEAYARLERRDPDDWPILALALAVDCPIWTEDRDFFGAGVATWTTDRVDRFFVGASKSDGDDAS